MAQEELIVLGPWTGDGLALATGFRPLVATAHVLEEWEDITGQPTEELAPDPNLMVARVRAQTAVATAIKANAQLVVLSSAPIEGT